ncbi:MAG: hypothetical protein WC865_11390 [Bacteroidales bacterium]
MRPIVYVSLLFLSLLSLPALAQEQQVVVPIDVAGWMKMLSLQ